MTPEDFAAGARALLLAIGGPELAAEPVWIKRVVDRRNPRRLTWIARVWRARRTGPTCEGVMRAVLDDLQELAGDAAIGRAS